jgi:hypothetical protein
MATRNGNEAPSWTVQVLATGTKALLMHNSRLANPMNEHSKKMAALTGKRGKTDDDRETLARVEFEGSMYFDPEIGPYVPASSVFRCLVDGARLSKLGKHIERGVTLSDIQFPLLYNGPRDIDGLWNGGNPQFVDQQVARVGTQKVVRTRPIFREWAFEFGAMLDPEVIDFEQFQQAARQAGKMCGLGDYRMFYGRFDVVVKKV